MCVCPLFWTTPKCTFFLGPCYTLPPTFMEIRHVVFPLSSWQTNWQTDQQHWKHNPLKISDVQWTQVWTLFTLDFSYWFSSSILKDCPVSIIGQTHALGLYYISMSCLIKKKCLLAETYLFQEILWLTRWHVGVVSLLAMYLCKHKMWKNLILPTNGWCDIYLLALIAIWRNDFNLMLQQTIHTVFV